MKEEDLDSIILDDKELYEHFRIVADKGQAQIRVDKFLMSRIENVSRNRLQNAAKAGNILVNGVVVKQNYRVKPNDVISIVMTTPPRITDVVAEDIPLNIIYEDADIIMINKAAGMVVHPAHGNFTGTLLNGLKFHLQYEMAKP